MGILNGVSRREDLGTGGVKYALIAQMDEVKITFINNTGSTASTATFTLPDGSAITTENTPFKKYAFTVDTASSDAPQVGAPSMGSSIFTHTVNMTFHRKSAALRNEIQALTQKETVVVMIDSNGYAELLGGQNCEGLHATAASMSSGIAKGDLNGYTITLTNTQPKAPYTVESTELAKIDANPC